MIASAQARNVAVQKPAKSLAPDGKPAPAIRRLPRGLEDALLLLCTAPLTTVKELARLGRVPPSTLRDRLEKLADLGLVDSVPHRMAALGPHPRRRYFPTEEGIDAAAMTEWGTERFLSEYPVSRQWFRLLAERLDSLAVLYHVAALISDADHLSQPVRVDHYRQGPYDLLVTLSGGRSVGLLRQGSTLPSANLRYRLRTIENLPWFQRPAVTLVITCSDQANRRAVRTLGHPMEHRTMFVATERKLLAGDHRALVWQQCGNGMADNPPVEITPDVPLDAIVSWTERLVESDELYRHKSGNEGTSKPSPDPDALYPEHLRAAMPQSSEQVKVALSVQLTGSEKDALDLLAAWPLCTTEQLMGLMGGVTRRRASQVLNSLTQRDLVCTDQQRHVLTDDGLRYLALRDRAAVRMALGHWSPRLWRPRNGQGRVYAGTALRTMASQLSHQDAITGVAAMLTAEATRSQDYDLLELLPTSRSSIGYYYQGANYVVHPDASFQLAFRGHCYPYFLEVERRAVTPKRVGARLENYRRYFASGWADQDHGGQVPLVLFVFETSRAEDAFQQAAARSHRLPLITSNLDLLAERGVLGDAWRPPPTYPPRPEAVGITGHTCKMTIRRSRRFL